MGVLDFHIDEDITVFEPVTGCCAAVAVLDTATERAPSWAVAIADAQGWQSARRESFLAGRAVAAAALQALGQSQPVLRADDGAPRWPAGMVGSIAHNAAFAIAIVAPASAVPALGVDVEPDALLPTDAEAVVLSPQDHAALATAFGATATAHARLVFSAKECVHKALYPLCGAWLEFDAVAIQWLATTADRGQWQAKALTPDAETAFAGQVLQGQWWRAHGALWTLLQLSR
ncbi:MAG: 4'-phosphopantetheinyl transferase superfamily protein [Stagnimonas sp.]|nr:4'-phosphopantetheinyl transferase superfamily protein [Stagnimonas sp.]